MKRDKLSFGTKINCTFAALATVLALTVWFGFRTAECSDGFAGKRHWKNSAEN